MSLTPLTVRLCPPLFQFVFPITIDDGSVQNLVLAAGDDVEGKVALFCGTHMATEPGCVDQLLPIVKERMA